MPKPRAFCYLLMNCRVVLQLSMQKIRSSKTRLLSEQKIHLRAEVQRLEGSLSAARLALSEVEIAERVLASLESWAMPTELAQAIAPALHNEPRKLPKKQTTRAFICSVMPIGKAMAKQSILDAVARLADLNQATVGVELSRMVKADLLVSNKRGTYTRKDNGLVM
jgi:hypothetical protein